MTNHNVLLVLRDAELKQRLLSELVLRRPASHGMSRRHYQVAIAESVEEALQRLSGEAWPAVIVLDHSALPSAADLHTQTPELRALAEKSVLVLLLDPAPQGMNGLAGLLRSGRLEIVLKSAQAPAACMPLVMALVERHTAVEQLAAAPREGQMEAWQDFGEILRHELNNPLTGILGNAELLLAHRERLPAADAERLKTIADMAVRLRETVRRLGNAWENCSFRSDEIEEVEK